MRDQDLYWLAGLLEGEGSFIPGPPSRPNQPRVQVAMTDEDVVQRVADLFGNSVQALDRRRAQIDRAVASYEDRRAKLAAEQVSRIRTLLADGVQTHRAIALQYGVSAFQIHKIARGARWKRWDRVIPGRVTAPWCNWQHA